MDGERGLASGSDHEHVSLQRNALQRYTTTDFFELPLLELILLELAHHFPSSACKPQAHASKELQQNCRHG